MKRSDESSANGVRGDSSSTATAVAAASANLSALQLLHVSSQLASWVHDDAYTHLPRGLHYGPVLLLQTAAENADSPHISSRLLDDTLVFLTYGVNYLQMHGDRTPVLRRIEQARAQRTVDRAHLHAHALRIQTQLRCQRFCTHSLPPLELATSASLIPEVQDMMRLGSPTSGDLTTAAVAVDETELQTQIDKYASELQARVESRRRDAELHRQRQQREHREREDMKKKQLYQKRRRHENACRRWNYFAGRLLRLHREENQQEIQSRVNARRQTIVQAPAVSETALHTSSMRRAMGTSSRQVVSITPSAQQLAKRKSKPTLRRAASSSLMKHAHSRNFIRQFVAKAIARGTSRVLCASNMRVAPRDSVASTSASSASAREGPSSSSSTDATSVLRIGILLCDVHFGIKYMGLYQRFLERAAREQGRVSAIEWQLFDCVKSQFPTRALQRVLHGFLAAGGPSTGADHSAQHHTNSARRPDTSESVDSDDGGTSLASRAAASAPPGSKQGTAGPWRKNLQRVLRQIYSDKRATLGGLGLGHIVLAEALGAKCGCEEWEDGWSVLDPKLFDATLLAANTSERRTSRQQYPHQDEPHRVKSKYVGIKYLHGEFVRSMDLAPRSMKVWRSLDQRFVSCFKDRWVLSFDGFPECGTFVFETMSELYDREKQSHASAAAASVRGGTDSGERQRRQRQRVTLKRESIPESGAFEALNLPRAPVRRTGVVDTGLTLDEKKKLLDVADISQIVAHALIDHFSTALTGTATPASDSAASAADVIDVAVAVNPVQCADIEGSIRAAAVAVAHGDGRHCVTSILLRVRSTLDGHLVVLGAQLDAIVRNHEHRVREGRRPSLTYGNSAMLMRRNSRHHTDEDASLLLSLHTLRDQKLVLLEDTEASATPSSPMRAERRERSAYVSAASGLSPKQRTVLNVPIQLPTLSASSSAAATPAIDRSVTALGVLDTGTNAIDAGASSSRKRPLPSVKRVRSSAIGVLTLSEALTRFQTELTAAFVRTAVAAATHVAGWKQQQQHVPLLQIPRVRVILQFADEESCKSAAHPFEIQRKSPEELRLLLLRLVAALRVSEVPDDCVCILSRQTSVLEFFRRRQPLWTFMKDCRRFAVLPPRYHVRHVGWYARYADVLLFDQEMLLSHSAKENEALVQQARHHGLQVFVAREDKALDDSAGTNRNNNNSSSSVSEKSTGDATPRGKRSVSQSLSKQRRSTFSGAGILAKAAPDKERAMEKDLQIVETLLLALTGIDGVVTPTPEVVLEAAEKLLSKSPIMSQVEQLFRTWQAKGSDKPLQKRRPLRGSSAGYANDQLDEDNEDYMGSADARDSDDVALVLDDSEIALEMARQYSEHGVRWPPSSSYVPLRPLQPKRGDQVLSAATRKQHEGLDSSAGSLSSTDAAARSRLRSIGTFRSTGQRNQVVQTPPHLEGTAVQLQAAAATLVVGGDDHVVIRPPEAVRSVNGLLLNASPSPRARRVHGARTNNNR